MCALAWEREKLYILTESQMEEHVGQIWHRIITRAAATGYPQATVELKEVSKTVGVLFRALGGDGGLRIELRRRRMVRDVIGYSV